MCDWTTIDPSIDVRINDAIRRDRVDENAILHFNENHKWYFMKDQSVEDLIVFRNADSFGKRARKLDSYLSGETCDEIYTDVSEEGFHCSVLNPETNGQLRESVEVRCVAFR